MSETNPEQERETPYFVFLRPGVAGEKAITAQLPQELHNATVERIINYALNKPDMTSEEQRVAQRIRVEMRESYEVTANNTAVGARDTIGELFQQDVFEDAEMGQLPYNRINITVAAAQEGGLEYRL